MTINTVSRCPNGKQGSLISWQPAVHSFSPAIHFFDCSDSTPRSKPRKIDGLTTGPSRLSSRQAPFSCDAPCSTTCSTNPGTPYNANDCDDLSRWMWQRSSQLLVKPQERVVLSWGTCMYAFMNAMQSDVTWCDAQWAQIGAYIARPCLTQSGVGGSCAGDGFLVEVLSNDGSTHTPVPYTAALTSPVPILSGTITASMYTDVPLPLMTTVSPTYTSTADPQYGTSYTLPVLPVVLGVVGGVAFLLIALVCVLLTRRRSQRGKVPLVSISRPVTPRDLTPGQASEDIHDVRPKPSETAYSKKEKGFRRDFSTFGSQSTTLPESQDPTLPRPPSPVAGSRVPTRLSTYTIEFDPFRSLRRALSGRRR